MPLILHKSSSTRSCFEVLTRSAGELIKLLVRSLVPARITNQAAHLSNASTKDQACEKWWTTQSAPTTSKNDPCPLSFLLPCCLSRVSFGRRFQRMHVFLLGGVGSSSDPCDVVGCLKVSMGWLKVQQRARTPCIHKEIWCVVHEEYFVSQSYRIAFTTR